jgi:hypothetical protein
MVAVVDVRDIVVPIQSPIRNAYIDFSKMNVSVVAIVTDVVREGHPYEKAAAERGAGTCSGYVASEEG